MAPAATATPAAKTAVKAVSKVAPTPSNAKSDQPDDSVRIVGLLKNTKQIESSNPNAKFQVTGFLGVSTKENFNDTKINVDLPADNFIASDNGQKLATEILEIQAKFKWVKIAMTGFWVTGDKTELKGNFHKCYRRQLRVQKYEVLREGPVLETK